MVVPEGLTYDRHSSSSRSRDPLSTSPWASSTITPNYLLYVSSKDTVDQMMRVLANDLDQKSINTNAVSPGPKVADSSKEE